MVTSSLLAPLILALAADAYVPPRVDLDTLLARPVSAGEIALLVPHLSDPRATERVTAAISHPDPAVRAAAARVASVVGMPAALPLVRTALDTETDRSAATEELSASVFLGRPEDDLALIPIARKQALLGLLALTVAAARGPEAIPSLDAFVAAGLAESAETGFIEAATRGGRQGLNVAGTGAVRNGSITRWSDVLALARQPGAALSPGLLVASIGSPKPEIRGLTYWHLAVTTPTGASLPTEIESAIARTADAGPDSDSDARFALVVLRRAQKGPDFGGDWGERAGAGKPMIPIDAMGHPDRIARLLTKAEAAAISARVTHGKSAKMFDWEKAPDTPAPAPSTARSGLWLTTALPAGVLRDMMAVTGCKPASDRLIAGLVRYRYDGRPRQVSVGDRGLPQPCAQIAGPALALSLVPAGTANPADPDEQSIAIVPLQASALECAAEAEPSAVERVDSEPGERGRIPEPRKVKSVPPSYPDAARAARIQGIVVLEAIISPSGCVSTLRVRQGVSPELDVAAMAAVSQWRYTPTLLNGKPVPVIMTITVNFRLS
jgi:TonB family protein